MKLFVGLKSGSVLRVAAVLFALYGCTDVPKLPPAPPAPPTSESYLVQPGDTLDVKFLYNPELNDQPTVQPDGRISMLLAHDMKVGGLTTEEIRQAISDAYSRELLKPSVSVALKGAVAWRIFIGGEVVRPNEFTGTGPAPTLTKAISLAGGLKDSGDGTKMVLLRRINGKPVGYQVAFNRTVKGEEPARDVQLKSNDTLFVPKTGVADVYTAFNQYVKQFLPSNVQAGYTLTLGGNTAPTAAVTPTPAGPAGGVSTGGQ